MRITHTRPFSGAVCLCLLLALLAPATFAGYERINASNPDDPMQVAIFRLDNGLTVHITENHETPRFYAEIAVRAGSKHDPPETTGLAHYFEHLMFKGSDSLGTLDYEKEEVHNDRVEELYEQHFRETDPEKRKAIYKEIDAETQKAAAYAVPNELDRVYDSMGATGLNAHTWVEETVYKVGLPKNRLRQWAAIESNRFVNPVFRLFPTELETVYEEKNRAMDNKHRIIYQAVNEVLYKKHPYGQETTLGRREHLKNPSIRKIRGFFDTWYAPNNMAIALSGDVDTEEAIAVIDEHFSQWEAKDLPKTKTWREKKLKGRETVTVKYEGEEYAMLAFRTVPHGHKDAEALLLADMVLSNATAGLIDLNLNQQQKVRQAGCYPSQMNDYGAQYFFGIPKDGQSLEEVEQLLLDQVALLKGGEFEDWILPAIINDFKKTEKAALESDRSRASMLIQAFLAHEPWDHAASRIARMEKLTKKDVVRVAKKYFRGNYVAGFRKDAPHEVLHVEKPELTPLEIDPTRQSEFGAQVLAMPFEPIEPEYVDPEKDFQRVESPHGVTLFHAPNPVNDLFSLAISIDFGSHEDNTIGTAVQLLRKSGTESLLPEDLKKEWYKLGTDFGIGAGDNETTITLSGLDENLEASVALLMDLLIHPAAEDAALEELKKIILVQREDAKKQAESISSALVQFNRYGEESHFLRILPAAELNALTVTQLHGVTRRLLGYKHTISYAGSLPMAQVQAILDRHHPVTAPLEEPPPYHYRKARRPEQTEILFFDKELAQSHVRLEFGSIGYDETLQPPIQLYNDYFAGGMAGIVFQELREARALAYMAGARYITGYRKDDENLMVGVIQTQPDKVPGAVEAFIDLLDNLPESEERFAIARQSIINRYRTAKIGFRGVIGAVRGWERHGLEPDPRKQRYEVIAGSSLAEVLAFHQAHITGRPKLISIVGEKANIDLERLKALGPVQELSIEDIFVD